jgi:DNA repair protein RecN (Recombination protein N)
VLRELHISNLAVIADARIELDRGLNCFTGVTGAGKSLVIGAVEVLLGLRPASELLRDGADEGRVSGVFEIDDRALLRQLEAATDLNLSADAGQVLLVRRLFASGRTSASINGHPITLAMLRSVAECLIDIHGQHDHQYLLRPANQLALLDAFCGNDSLRQEYDAAHAALRDVQQAADRLRAGSALRHEQLDLYRFQLDEIDAIAPEADEHERLSARSAVLSNVERLKRDAGAAYAALYEAEGAVLERLRMMSAVLAELGSLDAQAQPIAASILDATLQLGEAAFDLGRYVDKLDLDPAELRDVSDRLTALNRLMHKYGDPLSRVLRYRDQIAEKIAELCQTDQSASSLDAEIAKHSTAAKALAAELTRRRIEGARRLKPLVEGSLRELGMEQARFDVRIAERAGGLGAGGGDDVECFVRSNPGLSEHPLRKIASGGELSRVMLALKGILSGGAARVCVLVFDEIDANVGGRLGNVLGRRLRQLSRGHQVLCITHLPQIAAFADRHLTVRKISYAGQTHTTVRPISGQERVSEVAEMIAGIGAGATAMAQAREMLEMTANPSTTAVKSQRRAQTRGVDRPTVRASPPKRVRRGDRQWSR